MAGPLDPDITISVQCSVTPFKHMEQELMDIFARHKDEADVLDGMGALDLPNFAELKKLGPHPILESQMCDLPPRRWIKVRLEPCWGEGWVTLILRSDNVYVKGFSNQHGTFEMTEPAVRGGDLSTHVRLFPEEFCSVGLPWDLKYSVLLGVDRSRLAVTMRTMAQNPWEAHDAIMFLSGYIPNILNAQEAKRRMAALIFLFCEFMRMNIDIGNPFFLGHVHNWGPLCKELLLWRERNYRNWITAENLTQESRVYKKIKYEMGIMDVAGGLGLARLILNFKEKNISDNVPPERFLPIRIGNVKGNHGTSGISSLDCPPSSSASGAESSPCGSAPSVGRRRVQIVHVHTTFEVDAINFYDWHRGQAIYRRELDQEDGGLILIGPSRPIGAYGNIGVEIFPTSVMGRLPYSTDGNVIGRLPYRADGNVIIEAWTPNYSDDGEEPAVYRKEVYGSHSSQVVAITYVVIPYAFEAHIVIDLLLQGRNRIYNVSGSIMANSPHLGNFDIFIFREPKRESSFEVTCGERTRIPLRVPLLCLPNVVDWELDISVDLTLTPSLHTSSFEDLHCGLEDEQLGEQTLSFKGPDAFNFCGFVSGSTFEIVEINGNIVKAGVVIKP